MKSNNTELLKTIMNPSTGKMVQSGGQLGKKIIKDYKAETIYNPLTGKQVKTGGSVGKKVLGMYKAKGGEGCKVEGLDQTVTLCNIAELPIVKEALKEKRNAEANPQTNTQAKPQANIQTKTQQKLQMLTNNADALRNAVKLSINNIDNVIDIYVNQLETNLKNNIGKQDVENIIKYLEVLSHDDCNTTAKYQFGFNKCYKNMVDLFRLLNIGDDKMIEIGGTYYNITEYLSSYIASNKQIVYEELAPRLHAKVTKKNLIHRYRVRLEEIKKIEDNFMYR